MILVYVAAPFSEVERAKRLRDMLAERGIGCTSRWLHEEVQTGGKDPSLEQGIRFARMDRYDVRRAQAVVMLNPEEYKSKGTGGRHVETGMGYMLSDLPVFLVGVKSNIFVHLPEAELIEVDCATLDERDINHIANRIRMKCVDYGPTWDSPAEQAAKGVTLDRAEKARLDQHVSCTHEAARKGYSPNGRICGDCGAVLA